MSLQTEINELKQQVQDLTNKAQCKGCGKTLFFYDKNYIYIKCKHCKDTNQFLLDKTLK